MHDEIACLKRMLGANIGGCRGNKEIIDQVQYALERNKTKYRLKERRTYSAGYSGQRRRHAGIGRSTLPVEETAETRLFAQN